MRSIYIFLLVALSFVILSSQPDLTTEEWQEDLRYLQNLVHKEYQSLFRKVTQEEFDNAVESLYGKIPEMEDHEVMVGLAEIVALFKYGHTALWLTSWRYNRLVDFHQMPYSLYWFKEGIFVQGTHKDYARALGARVVKVGDMSIEEAVQKIRPVVSAENDQFFKAHGLHYLGVPEVLHAKGVIRDMSSVTLTLEKEGKQFEMSFSPRVSEEFPGNYGLIRTQGDWLEARPNDMTPLWMKHLERRYFYEYLPNEKTVYVRQSEVQDDEGKSIAEFYEEVFQFIEANDVEKMILDVRLNSGGNNYKNKPVITGLIKCQKINHKGKLFVVLGRRTFSACQNLVNDIENFTEAIFVGEATAENVNFMGDNRKVKLPNSDLTVALSYLWWQDKDPRDNRPWTPPHIAVDVSFEDYMKNIDPVMNAIFSSDGTTGITDPWQHLVELFMAGKMEEVQAKAHEFVKDPKYRYYDFEDRLNDAGYQLMGAGQFQEAVGVLNLNAELFPESANCWDSLAEAHWKAGDKVKATEYYKKAIKMDPDGLTGENARVMLEKMKSEHD